MRFILLLLILITPIQSITGDVLDDSSADKNITKDILYILNADKPINPLTDLQFAPYIKKFEYYRKSSTIRTPISLADLSPKVAGVCRKTMINKIPVYSYVEINRDYWFKISELQRTNLVFHELGHCALNRGHVRPIFKKPCPSSFMHYQVMSNNCLKVHYNKYIREMFHEI